jgi:hypothetical protein
VVFPLLVMGLLFYRSEKRWSFSVYLKAWPFWLYLLTRETILNFNSFFIVGAPDMSMDSRIYSFLATLPVYLKLLVWPTGLHMDRLFPIRTRM